MTSVARGRGRPQSIPADARTRSIRLTDAEYKLVFEYLRVLRKGK